MKSCHDFVQTIVDLWPDWDEQTKVIVSRLLAGDKVIESPTMLTMPSVKVEDAKELMEKITEQLRKSTSILR